MIVSFCRSTRCVRLSRLFCNNSNFQVLGIESSCDDTSAAVVNSSKSILGESHFSQFRIHLESGGVLPNVAENLHRDSLKQIVESSMKQSGLDIKDLSAVAVSVKPGLILSLKAGVEFAKDLCSLYRKPLIPIHHMEAHALTGRLIEDVKFPFLTFLMSGAHCILALVKSPDKFYRLGESIDSSPGVVLDKFVRRSKLRNLKKFRGLVGGQAVEAAAVDGDPTRFQISFMTAKDCNFSFSGIMTACYSFLSTLEKKHNIGPDGVVPEIKDLCASLQWSMARHMCHRLEVAINYIDEEKLIEDEKCVVVSGGVASNKLIRTALKIICDARHYKMVVPPPSLCTDNGAMIAWNGIERLKANLAVVKPEDLASVNPIAKFPLGEDISERVLNASRTYAFKYVKGKDILKAVQDVYCEEGNKNCHKSAV